MLAKGGNFLLRPRPRGASRLPSESDAISLAEIVYMENVSGRPTPWDPCARYTLPRRALRAYLPALRVHPALPAQ